MRRMLILGILMGWSGLVSADTVCQVISTEQVVESFSNTQPDGTCLKDLMSSGIANNDIAQLTVTAKDRADKLTAWQIDVKNPDVPVQQAALTAKQKLEADRASGDAKLKALGLTDAEIAAQGSK